MTNRREQQDLERRREAQAVLDRVAREADTIGTSTLARTVDAMKSHFGAADAPADDPAELWGRRIARVLALAIVAGLIVSLVGTYLLK